MISLVLKTVKLIIKAAIGFPIYYGLKGVRNRLLQTWSSKKRRPYIEQLLYSSVLSVLMQEY